MATALPNEGFFPHVHPLERADPSAIMRWATRRYSGRIALACSFGGPTGLALVDMLSRIDPTVPVYYLDTGLLFEETYALIREVASRYGIVPRRVAADVSLDVQAKSYGDRLWERDPDRCCEIRKVEPQRSFLRNFDAWISGLRRDQSPTRRAVRAIETNDRFGLVKISPFAHSSEDDVVRYLEQHNVPTNQLHREGYPSVGCIPCTQRVAAGETPRAGRWRGTLKTECGLHFPSSKPA